MKTSFYPMHHKKITYFQCDEILKNNIKCYLLHALLFKCRNEWSCVRLPWFTSRIIDVRSCNNAQYKYVWDTRKTRTKRGAENTYKLSLTNWVLLSLRLNMIRTHKSKQVLRGNSLLTLNHPKIWIIYISKLSKIFITFWDRGLCDRPIRINSN